MALIMRRTQSLSRCRTVRQLEYAYLTHESPPFHSQPRTGAQKRGLAYERKALRELENRYKHEFIPHPWFWYKETHSLRGHYCQPDGLLIRVKARQIIVTEIKLRHTADAYYQLFDLYLPVVRAVFGAGWSYGAVEVVRWFDPDEPVPAPARLCKRPDVVNQGVFGVHICRA